MGDRLGTLEPSSLTGQAKSLYDDIVAYFEGHVNYVYKGGDGRMVGPFGLELRTPGPGYAWLNMTKSLANIPGLPPLAREVAILVTGFHEQAAYEIYAHTAVSGFSGTVVEQIQHGVCPAALDYGCKVAFDVATELCKTPGPLNVGVWKEAVEVFGMAGATALIHYVASTSMSLRS